MHLLFILLILTIDVYFHVIVMFLLSALCHEAKGYS